MNEATLKKNIRQKPFIEKSICCTANISGAQYKAAIIYESKRRHQNDRNLYKMREPPMGQRSER